MSAPAAAAAPGGPPGLAGRRIVSAGSVIVDLSMQVPAMPQAGGDVLASAPVSRAGGGLNLMYAAARQGAAVAYAGSYGTGPRGRLVRQALRELGVTVLQRASRAGDTGLSITFVDARAERSFVTAPGAEATLSAPQLAGIALRPGDVVALSGYDLAYPGAVDALVTWVDSFPDDLPVLLDPGPLVLEIPAAAREHVLRRVAVLTVNEREARLLAGRPDGDAAALHAQIRRRHPLREDALLVIRRGADGCTFGGETGRAEVTEVPAMSVTAVDTTGAGDTHTGVFLAEWITGTGVYAALRRANVAAAISVTRTGPATAPDRAEIDQALAGLARPAAG